jgi:glycosyltransferase involved in cell wall biosynthesis
MSCATPRVSIGVPVYNGQKYIRYTLDSLLAQTFTDVEVIVTDNCSTDSTPQIVLDYAQRDPRVRYVKNPSNIGPARNYRVSMDMARGDYFKWNPADDVCAPTFLERCVKVLDEDPTVVVAYPRTNVIDTNGEIVDRYNYEIDFDLPSAAHRLWRMMTVNHKEHGAHEMYGLIRLAALRKTPGMRTHVRGDSVLLARLALLGRFRRIDEYLFFNRDHTDRSSKYLSRKLVRKGSRLSKFLGCGPLPSAEWWDPSLKGRIVFPEWRVLREYIRAVQETDSLGAADRFACYRSIALFTTIHSPKMARDLVIAAEQLINSALGIADESKEQPTTVAAKTT